ncbi:ankyrin repeat protein [Nannochloropsis oceanica]
MLATYLAREEVVDVLLKEGAEVQARASGGSTCLHIACRVGHLGIARRLVAAGAARDARTQNGSTPLHTLAAHQHRHHREEEEEGGREGGRGGPSLARLLLFGLEEEGEEEEKEEEGWKEVVEVETTFKRMQLKGGEGEGGEGPEKKEGEGRGEGEEVGRSRAQKEIREKGEAACVPAVAAATAATAAVAAAAAAAVAGASATSAATAAAAAATAASASAAAATARVASAAAATAADTCITADSFHTFQLQQRLQQQHQRQQQRKQQRAAAAHALTRVAAIDGTTALHVAAQSGNLPLVTLLLAPPSLASSSSPNALGITPLVYACHYGHTAVVATLLEEGGREGRRGREREPSQGGEVGRGGREGGREGGRVDLSRALRHAAQRGHTDVVKLLLLEGAGRKERREGGKRKGADGEGRREGGKEGEVKTALQCAAAGGHVEVLRLLLKSGMGDEEEGVGTKSPLYYAAKGGYPEAVRELLQHAKITENQSRASAAAAPSPLLPAAILDTTRVGVVEGEGGRKGGKDDEKGLQRQPFTTTLSSSTSSLPPSSSYLPSWWEDAASARAALHVACRKGHVEVVHTLLDLLLVVPPSLPPSLAPGLASYPRPAPTGAGELMEGADSPPYQRLAWT